MGHQEPLITTHMTHVAGARVTPNMDFSQKSYHDTLLTLLEKTALKEE